MTWDRRAFLAACGSLLAAPGAARHAALFVYTQPLVRARHRAIVQAALEKRAVAHTSGWAIGTDRKPLLAIGPVRGRAAQFNKRQQLVTPVQKAWPFVVVLEYDAGGRPTAFIDWFRRAADSTDPTGWLVDPGVGYAEHINAELVTALDEDLGMMALADTPTQTYVGGAHWAVRARVDWQDGSRARKGWWLQLEAPLERTVDHWRAVETPLVDWRVAEERRGLGITATGPVDDPDRELAVLATATVFRFPAVPAGLTSGPGRP